MREVARGINLQIAQHRGRSVAAFSSAGVSGLIHLCFASAVFSRVVLITSSNLMHNLLFYFPIPMNAGNSFWNCFESLSTNDAAIVLCTVGWGMAFDCFPAEQYYQASKTATCAGSDELSRESLSERPTPWILRTAIFDICRARSAHALSIDEALLRTDVGWVSNFQIN